MVSCVSGPSRCASRVNIRELTGVVSRVSTSSTISLLRGLNRDIGRGLHPLVNSRAGASVHLVGRCSRSRVKDLVAAGCVYVAKSLAVHGTVRRLVHRTNRGSGVSAVCTISNRGGFYNTVSLGSLVVTERGSSLGDMVDCTCPCLFSRRGVSRDVRGVGSCTRSSLPILGGRGGVVNVVATRSIIRVMSSRLNRSCTGLNNLSTRRSLGRATKGDVGGEVP